MLEKLIGDEEFRTGFFEDPDAAIAKAGIELNEEELAGLKGLDLGVLSSTLTDLDVRLSKTDALGTLTGSLLGSGLTGLYRELPAVSRQRRKAAPVLFTGTLPGRSRGVSQCECGDSRSRSSPHSITKPCRRPQWNILKLPWLTACAWCA